MQVLECSQKKSVDWFLEFLMVSLEGVEYHQKAEEGAESREEMIHRNEREKLCESSPPLIMLWSKLLGEWPSPTSGSCRFLLEACEWFLHQMETLARAKYTWSEGRMLELPGEEDKEYSRFWLKPEELERLSWMDPVESVRRLERPKDLSIPLLELDMVRVKSKEIGERCTAMGRCQRWSLLEWARMNPRELSKFFVRMEKDMGFQRFYRRLYNGMRLCYFRMFKEKVEEVKKRLKSAVLLSLKEESESLRWSEAETNVRKKRVAWLNKLSSDWEYEERTKWKGEVPALPSPKKKSGIKRKMNPRPGKLKRMRMISLKESAAGSTTEELAGIPPSQPSPGSSRARNGLRGIVSGSLWEDSYEEVVILNEEDDMFMENEEEKEVEVPIPRR